MQLKHRFLFVILTLMLSSVASAQQLSPASPGTINRPTSAPEGTGPQAPSVTMPRYFYKHLTGTIGGTEHIVMNMTRIGDRLVGDYYSEADGIPYFFGYGSTISKEGQVHIVETDPLGDGGSSRVSGVFDGQFVGSNELRGTWQTGGSPQSSPQSRPKSLTFALTTPNLYAGSFDVEHRERGYYDRALGSASITIDYPVMRTDSAEADAAFNTNVVTTIVGLYENGVGTVPPTSISQAMGDFIHSFTSQLAHPAPRNYFPPWTYSITGTILFDSSTILSVRYESFSFEGGAHPNTVYTNANYLRATGSQLTLDDLLKPGSQDALNKIGLREFRRQHGVKPGESLSSAGYFVSDQDFKLTPNFLIVKAGLLFQFNQYEIGPYYFGAQEVLIPYAALKPVLRANSPIASLVANAPPSAAADSGTLPNLVPPAGPQGAGQ